MKKVKKILKNNVKVLVGIIIGTMVTGTGVYAATVINASDVSYKNASSEMTSTNVQGAIEELNTKATTKIKEAEAKCPKGYDCTKSKLCKRATTLHTETCTQTVTPTFCSGDGYTASGSMGTKTITYGNLGTKGTLTSGDAFDCDVNGDGVYDSETERFYYVARMNNGITHNTNIAVLIYYNNVSGGVASNSASFAYDSSNESWHGPVTAITQLPTTSQWSNVSLTNPKRQITNEVNGTTSAGQTLPTAFSYEGYAARLLTAQEVNAGCSFTVGKYNLGELSKMCKYMYENTEYSSSGLTNGEWLESPRGDGTSWGVSGGGKLVGYWKPNQLLGVRPAIEVPITNISY